MKVLIKTEVRGCAYWMEQVEENTHTQWSEIAI